MNIRVYAKSRYDRRLLIGEIQRESLPSKGQLCELTKGVSLPVDDMGCHGPANDDPFLSVIISSELDFNLLCKGGFEDHTPGR